MSIVPAAEGAPPPPGVSRLGQWSWAMFEGGRIPYVLLITIYIYAPYFTTQIVGDPVRGQSLLNGVNSFAGFLIFLLAPPIGAIADSGLQRKPWIVIFLLIMAPLIFSLWWGLPGDGGIGIWGVLAVFLIASVSLELSGMFHNAMLPTLAPHEKLGALSGLGLALGNGSGVLLLILMLVLISLPGVVDWPFVLSAPLFGLDKTQFQDARIAGPIAAIYMTIFLFPLLLFTPDRAKTGITIKAAVRQGMRRLAATIRALPKYRNVTTYIIARALYNDGKTAALINGGIYAAGTFKWGVLEMLCYGVTLSIFATFGGILGGWMDDRFGSRNAILASIGATTIILIASLGMGPTTILYFIDYVPPPEENVLGLPFFKTWPEIIYICIVVLIAISITAAYANSRTMLARIAPPEKMTEFFGIYALSGNSITWLATGAVSLFTWLFESQRAGMFSILLFLIPGFILMLWVTNERDRV
jgi:MFS transporter, UMF1 family